MHDSLTSDNTTLGEFATLSLKTRRECFISMNYCKGGERISQYLTMKWTIFIKDYTTTMKEIDVTVSNMNLKEIFECTNDFCTEIH